MQGPDRRQSGKSLKFHGFLFVWVLLGVLAASGIRLFPPEGHAAETSRPEIIVIDPGHGGNDHGVRGAAGTLEKDAVLRFARILAAVLAPDYAPVLTRTGDYQLDAVKRASAANYHRARLFITLHAGGGFRRQMDRWSVFYYREEGIQGTASGPVSPEETGTGIPAGIEWERVQQPHQQASRDLAECIRSSLSGHPEIQEVQVAGAPLGMLQGIDRPAIAIETGFLTNAETENRLNSDVFLTDAARLIKKGIDVYVSR